MKKLKLLLIILFFSTSLVAQNHRFIYEYSFKIDSLNRENISKEIMNLDLTKEGSNFYSSEKFIYDSLVNVEFKKAEATQSTNIDLSKIKQNSKVGFSITKNYPSFETTLHTSISTDQFALKQNEKINWNILPETKDIDGFKTQKATTKFGGRKWIAWFTPDILFQEGPYKFYGLPGLILSIEDEKGDHIFKFIGSKKLNHIAILDGELEENEIEITPEKFTQLWKEYLSDPAKKLKQLYSSSEGTIKVTDANGKELSQSEVIRNKEQRAKEKVKKTNNFLELELYK